MVPLSRVNKLTDIAKTQIFAGKRVYIRKKAVAESSKGQSWSLPEQGIVQGSSDYFKPWKSIFSLLTSAMIHSFLHRDQASSASTPWQTVVQGATGQLLPANTRTAVGGHKTSGQTWLIKETGVPFTFLYFPPRSAMLAQNTFPLQELAAVVHIGNVALRQCNFPWGIHKQALLTARTALHFYLGSQEDWKTVCALHTDVWYQMSPNTLCFP